jgi:phosphatidate cytidylyltransferase
MAGNAATAPRPARPAERGALRRRILSALVLVPIALGAIWAGEASTTILVALAGGLMAWEWGKLIGRLDGVVEAALFVAVGAGTVLVAGFWSAPAGLICAVVGIAGLTLSGMRRQPGWTAAGLGWILLATICFVVLRADPVAGWPTTLWLLLVVWAIDTAAYVVGRSVGGPKLAPRISPNKTWSGLLGGMAGAVLVGLVFGWIDGVSGPWSLALVSGGLAVVEQIGDIAESYAKRRFGAKDSGNLIPGHGGLLDRLDGMLAVVTAIVLLQIVTGERILTWR